MNPAVPRPAFAVSTLALVAISSIAAAQPAAPTPPPARPLESWTNTLPKEVLGRFVRGLPPATADDFAVGKVRVAVFGTEDVLWDGGPVSLETKWALNRVRSLAAGRPEWKTTPPFSAVLSDDPEAVADLSPDDLSRLTGAAIAGLEPHEVHRDVLSWVRTARPDGRSPADLARPAMHELLVFLRSWGFRNHVVSDGPAEVTRALVEALYGLPAYRVIAPPSPIEVREPAGATRLVLTGEPAPPSSGESRLRDVMRQVGTRPLFVAASRAKDAPFMQWSAGPGGPFLALVFFETGRNPGDRFQSLRPAIPVGRWTVVVPSRDWRVRSVGPKASAK
jgi:hypothetical protein